MSNDNRDEMIHSQRLFHRGTLGRSVVPVKCGVPERTGVRCFVLPIREIGATAAIVIGADREGAGIRPLTFNFQG